MERETYIIIEWPESQGLMDMERFEEFSYLVNDERWVFISPAYFVLKDWYEHRTQNK